MITPERLIWQCRRGMLELDLMLMPFAREVYPTLTESLQVSFESLLTLPDPVLFAWLMGSLESEKEYDEIVQQIRTYLLRHSA